MGLAPLPLNPYFFNSSKPLPLASTERSISRIFPRCHNQQWQKIYSLAVNFPISHSQARYNHQKGEVKKWNFPSHKSTSQYRSNDFCGLDLIWSSAKGCCFGNEASHAGFNGCCHSLRGRIYSWLQQRFIFALFARCFCLGNPMECEIVSFFLGTGIEKEGIEKWFSFSFTNASTHIYSFNPNTVTFTC